MGKSYSMEMRERVARDVARGQTVRTVAARFEVSVASAVRWSYLAHKDRWHQVGDAGGQAAVYWPPLWPF